MMTPPRLRTGNMLPISDERTALSRALDPINRYVGIEVELVAMDWAPLHAFANRWNASIVADSTIQDSMGAELNLPPVRGTTLFRMIEDLSFAVNSAGAKDSNRCGVHVHVDCRDLTPTQLHGVIRFWALLEPALFNLIPEDRRQSKYCKPIRRNPWIADFLDTPNSDARDFMIRYAAVPSGTTAKDYGRQNKASPIALARRSDKHAWHRYYSLNLAAYWAHKTVENRMPEWSTDIGNILGWALLSAAVVDRGANWSEEKKSSIDSDLSGLIEVAPTPGLRNWIIRRWQHYAP